MSQTRRKPVIRDSVFPCPCLCCRREDRQTSQSQVKSYCCNNAAQPLEVTSATALSIDAAVRLLPCIIHGLLCDLLVLSLNYSYKLLSSCRLLLICSIEEGTLGASSRTHVTQAMTFTCNNIHRPRTSPTKLLLLYAHLSQCLVHELLA